MNDELYFQNNISDIQRKDEERVALQRAEAYNLPYLNLSMAPTQEGAISVLKEQKAREARVAILYKKGDAIKIAVEDPKNEKTKFILEDLKSTFKNIAIVVVSRSSLEDVWEKYPQKNASEDNAITGYVKITPSLLEKFKNKIKSTKDIEGLLSDVTETNASQIFEVILSSALTFDATDVHIEPQRGKTDIRLKIDGILYEVATIDEHLYTLILSRIKLLSKLKLNIHNEPQEGRFSVVFEKREIEIRTSILPSEYNEDIALRILDPKFLLSLSELGLREDLEEKLQKQLQQPQGSILVTGPTGSGKTTTLYAGLRFLKERELKIITIEDPIEYHLEGITQSQINPKKNYTFEVGLRAILRQDPDIILISELRTIDAANAAMQAALAGRMVLSTLHTIDAAGTAPRLIDLGADPSTVSSAISASIAQRLIRKLCKYCKQKKKISKQEQAVFKKIMENFPPNIKHAPINSETPIYSPTPNGCIKCRYTGYKGRTAIFEIILITEKIKEQILQNPTEEEIRKSAEDEGMTNIKQDAILRILEGITSFEEAERILGTLE